MILQKTQIIVVFNLTIGFCSIDVKTGQSIEAARYNELAKAFYETSKRRERQSQKARGQKKVIENVESNRTRFSEE